MHSITLRVYLTRLVWVCAAPLLLLAAYFAYENLQKLERGQDREANDIATNVATAYDRQLRSRIGTMEILARSELLLEPGQRQHLYDSARAFSDSFDSHLILADTSGQMLLNTRVPFGSPLPRLPAPKAQAAAPIALATGRPAVSNQFVGPVALKPLVAIAVPVMREGVPVYLLVATIEPVRFERTLDDLRLPPGWTIELLDGTGETLARRESGGTEGASARMKRYVAPLTGAPWSVAVSRPSGSNDAAVASAAVAMGTLFLVAMLASLVGGRFAGSKLNRELASLAESKSPDSLAAVRPAEIREVATIRSQLVDAEVRRRASEERYRTAFMTSPDAMTLTDLPDGTYYDVNDGFTRMLGWTREEALGRTPFELEIWHNLADRQRFIALMQSQGECKDFETRFRTHDGRLITAVLSSRVLDLGDRRAIMTITRDVTERRRVEDTLRKLSLAVEQSAAIVMITDLSHRIEYVNEGFVRQTGFTREEALGKTPNELLGSGSTPAPVYESLRLAMAAQQPWQGEFANRHKDGRPFISSATISPLRQLDGTVTHYVAVQEDVTAARQLSAELAGYRNHLEELVAERTREVEQMRDELARRADIAEAANVAKSSFLANMSHEIRTPMNAILGFAHLLMDSPLTPEQSDRVAKLEAAGEHLLEIINSILDLSKIDAGKVELERVDFSLAAVLETVEALVRATATAKGLALHVDIAGVPDSLRGDPTRLRQALLNFAGNAVKFTSRGSVTIRARMEREEAERLLIRFEVIDTGIGISPDQAVTLFQPFQQGNESMTRKFGGTGLGLVIARRFANLMGGDAGVESREGLGSTFWFTAWLGRGESRMTGNTAALLDAAAALRKHHAGARILLAEDNEINQEVARAMLARAGLSVDVAADGQEAVAMSMNGYDLILMDLQMPNLDGLAATKAIRALEGGSAIPILAMTADAFEEDRRRCVAAGMDDFLSKPVEPRRLYALLFQHLERSRKLPRAED